MFLIGGVFCLSSLLFTPFLILLGEESSKDATLWPKREKALLGVRGGVTMRFLILFLTHLPPFPHYFFSISNPLLFYSLFVPVLFLSGLTSVDEFTVNI